VEVHWEIAEDANFTRVVQAGTSCAYYEDDHTVRVDPAGLRPGTRYFYRFHAENETSVTGRTKTLPEDNVTHLRFAQASCAKYNAGFFNAYARITTDDLDFLLHLGDYIYGHSTRRLRTIPGADIVRSSRCMSARNSRITGRATPNIIATLMCSQHASLPMIATVDDHEFADGAWRGGADVHNEEQDGLWSDRLKDCFRARWEWLPVRHPNPEDPSCVYRTVRLGELADLFMINTRTYRDQPVPPPAMYSEDRTALGPGQREWLFELMNQQRPGV
jgi:alkaline phosphatase D